MDNLNDSSKDICSFFCEKARAVSAVVTQIETMQAAFQYAADLCRKNDPASGQAVKDGAQPPQNQGGENAAAQKIVAAPGLDSGLYAEFEKVCAAGDLKLVNKGLRDHLAGVTLGFTIADYGIAETGTLVINCPSEELRLATMICDFHVAVLPMGKIRKSAYDLEAELTKMFSTSPDYTSFITGASRTADIERVLALGVHGPLELHILLMEEK